MIPPIEKEASGEPWSKDFTKAIGSFYSADSEGIRYTDTEGISHLHDIETLILGLERETAANDRDFTAWVYATPENGDGLRLAVRQHAEVDQTALDALVEYGIDGVDEIPSAHYATEMMVFDRDGRAHSWFSNEDGDPIGFELVGTFKDFPILDATELSRLLSEYVLKSKGFVGRCRSIMAV